MDVTSMVQRCHFLTDFYVQVKKKSVFCQLEDIFFSSRFSCIRPLKRADYENSIFSTEKILCPFRHLLAQNTFVQILEMNPPESVRVFTPKLQPDVKCLLFWNPWSWLSFKHKILNPKKSLDWRASSLMAVNRFGLEMSQRRLCTPGHREWTRSRAWTEPCVEHEPSSLSLQLCCGGVVWLFVIEDILRLKKQTNNEGPDNVQEMVGQTFHATDVRLHRKLRTQFGFNTAHIGSLNCS